MRPAGIFRDVAADGAGFLAGGIRRKIKSGVLYGARDIQIDHAGLDDGAAILQVQFQDAVHTRKDDHHAASASQRAAGESRARASANDRNLKSIGNLDDPGNVLRCVREDDDVGPALFNRAIEFVHQQVFLLRQNVSGTEKRFQFVDESRVHG